MSVMSASDKERVRARRRVEIVSLARGRPAEPRAQSRDSADRGQQVSELLCAPSVENALQTQPTTRSEHTTEEDTIEREKASSTPGLRDYALRSDRSTDQAVCKYNR